MTPQQAISHFGSQSKLAAALGLKQPSIAGWVTEGKIPEPRQYQIEIVSGGKLKADRADK